MTQSGHLQTPSSPDVLHREHDSAWNPQSQLLQLERYVQKKQFVRIGTAQVWRSGGYFMTARDEYLLRAAELSAMAQVETDQADKVEFENLARAYLRLAEQAGRNSQTNVVYETPPKKDRDQAAP